MIFSVIDSHPDNAPSLRIDNPFPALLEYSTSLDLASMDSTDLGHVPYVYILIRAMEEWKVSVRLSFNAARLLFLVDL